MKYVVVVPDGMADRPVDELGGQTPVEAADTPNMDYVADMGVCGLAKTFFDGLPYDSSVANMSILGYDPRKYFSGRSPLEAANVGVHLRSGDVSLRTNLITVKDGKIADFTAGHISNEEAKKLMGSLDEVLGSDDVSFHPGKSYRNICLLKSALNPSTEFTAYAPHDIVGQKVSEYMVSSTSPGGRDTCILLNRLTKDAVEVLADHPVNRRRVESGKNPANWIWLWGAGTRPTLPSFEQVFGLKASIVSAVDLLNGLGKTVGMEVLEVEGVTGYIDTNYEGKVDAALDSLDHVDLAYIHLESPDETGHEGDVEKKIKAIEDVDKRVLGRLFEGLDADFSLLLMPDHPTPVCVRTHTTEPVPYAIYNPEHDGDEVCRYSESEISAKGSIELTEAYKLMGNLLS